MFEGGGDWRMLQTAAHFRKIPLVAPSSYIMWKRRRQGGAGAGGVGEWKCRRQRHRGVQLHPSTGKHHEDGVTFFEGGHRTGLWKSQPQQSTEACVHSRKADRQESRKDTPQPEPFHREHERRLQEQVPALMAFLYRCTFSSAQVAGQKRSRESLQLMQQRVVGVASVLVYSISRSASDFQRSVGTQLVTRGKDGRLKLCNTFSWAISDDAVKKMLRDSNVFDVDSVFQPHESIHAATDNYEQKMLHTYLHSLVRNTVLHTTTLTAWRQSRVDVPRDQPGTFKLQRRPNGVVTYTDFTPTHQDFDLYLHAVADFFSRILEASSRTLPDMLDTLKGNSVDIEGLAEELAKVLPVLPPREPETTSVVEAHPPATMKCANALEEMIDSVEIFQGHLRLTAGTAKESGLARAKREEEQEQAADILESAEAAIATHAAETGVPTWDSLKSDHQKSSRLQVVLSWLGKTFKEAWTATTLRARVGKAWQEREGHNNRIYDVVEKMRDSPLIPSDISHKRLTRQEMVAVVKHFRGKDYRPRDTTPTPAIIKNGFQEVYTLLRAEDEAERAEADRTREERVRVDSSLLLQMVPINFFDKSFQELSEQSEGLTEGLTEKLTKGQYLAQQGTWHITNKYSEPYRGPLTTNDEDEIMKLGYPSVSMMLHLSVIEDYSLCLERTYSTASQCSAANNIKDVQFTMDSLCALLNSQVRRWGAGLDNGAALVEALAAASIFIQGYVLSQPPEGASLPEEIRAPITAVLSAFYTAQNQMSAMMKRATRARCPIAGDQGVWQHLSNPKLQALYPWLTPAMIGELHIQINNEMMATTSRSPMWEALIKDAGLLTGYSWHRMRDTGSVGLCQCFDMNCHLRRKIALALQLVAMLTYKAHHPGEIFTFLDVAQWCLEDYGDEHRGFFTFLTLPFGLVYRDNVVRKETSMDLRQAMLKIMLSMTAAPTATEAADHGAATAAAAPPAMAEVEAMATRPAVAEAVVPDVAMEETGPGAATAAAAPPAMAEVEAMAARPAVAEAVVPDVAMEETGPGAATAAAAPPAMAEVEALAARPAVAEAVVPNVAMEETG
ncbi:hypothetical protein CYMTET_43301, partial [Cymbomonas tetramitiformis]